MGQSGWFGGLGILFGILVSGCGGESTDSAGHATGGTGGSAGTIGAGGVSGTGGEAGANPKPAAAFYLDDQKIETAFWGDPYYLKVTGLLPGQSVTLRARADVIDQQELESSATFQAAPDGSVDVSRDAPISGSYSGVDADGLIWSSAPSSDGENQLMMNQVEVRVEADAGELTRATLSRYYLLPDAIQVDVHENGLVGVYYAPNDGNKHPALIAFGGSEGGLDGGMYEAAYWASRGYAAIGVAYFAESGLPDYLEKIPLEYFEKARDFLATRPEADANRVAVMGGSRGGELALLLGATFPWVKAVIAQLPSAVSWGAPQWSGPELASWTYAGQGLPFVPTVPASPTKSEDSDGTTLYHYRDTFTVSIDAASPTVLEQATAKVENAKGPVLMIGGADDQLWPSCDLAEFARKRLESSGHASQYADELVCFPDAGHNVGAPGSSTLEAHRAFHPITKEWLALGGTPAGIAHACRQADQKIKALLEKTLK